jgi:hypothetical protein
MNGAKTLAAATAVTATGPAANLKEDKEEKVIVVFNEGVVLLFI